MSGPSDMNIIIGQGSTIKEVHNVKKQSLEVNQQFVTQKSEDQKGENKTKVQEYETDNRIEIKKDEEGKKKKDHKKHKKDKHKEEEEDKKNLMEGNVIDIRV